MIENLLPVVTLITALGCGLMAGIFFTFSNFMMTALGEIKPAQAVAAMQAINRVILNPGFFIVFVGTALASLLLAAALLFTEPELEAGYLLAGSACYLLGVIVVTGTRNVPMNNALDAVDADSAEAAQLWATYLRDWTRWNHVRSVASLAGTLFFILALVG